MNPLDYRENYRRNLPHIQPEGATLFVTFRLAGSLPTSIVEQILEEAAAAEKQLAEIDDDAMRERMTYRERKRRFGRWDIALDNIQTGPHWLANPAIANLVANALHFRDGSIFDLDCYTIMSNHVHVLFTPLKKDNGSYHALQAIMHSLKRYTARKANDILSRTGQFWHYESYDHYVRDDDELNRIRLYIINNPVKAGLVNDWREWQWTYCNTYSDLAKR